MEKEDLLRLLEAHGKQFVASFTSPPSQQDPRRRGGKKRKIEDQSSEEEWQGISTPRSEASDVEIFDDTDEEITESESARAGPSRKPDVVVFSGSQVAAETSAKASRAQMKAFMSSKVSKLTQEVQESQQDGGVSDEDDELSNAQNDALLHRLVHTRILSGSLNPDLDLTPAQRKKALAGRVLEAAGKAKLGKGETTVRSVEHKKAAKHVREGMKVKRKERSEKELEDAKLLGNYHPTLKRLYDSSSSSHSRGRKRERGMKMGVGSFRGGILKLSREEISSAEGGGSRGARRGRGSHERGRQ
ncbi:hypothetical protein B0H21DRAFT_778619 [Amylocystis lapponica]|nr:hypothetical protein B0H21DRAFT_778619 [Amylocystis lapponica]